MIRRVLSFALATLFIASRPQAYVLDYGLDDHFFIESKNTKTGKTELQIWDITLRRGLVDQEEAFIDFNLAILKLRAQGKNAYTIDDFETYHFEPSKFDQGSFYNGIFRFEHGITQKRQIKIEFNEDGSLKDITGSEIDSISPDNVATFRLVKENISASVSLENKFSDKQYSHEKRPSIYMGNK